MQTGRPTWRSRAWPVAGTVLLLLVVALGTTGLDGPSSGRAVVVVVVLVVASVIGWAVIRTREQRRRYEGELAGWAAERAAQTERLRIAAEIHDLVSHGLGVITVRAAAARSMTGAAGQAERADALADIERTSRETTTELRRMLGVLRTPGQASLRPADTLADLPAIVDAAERAGAQVSLSVEEPGEVSPGVQLTACAIVREALTNAVRHAGPTRVRVRRDGDVVVVEVADDGPRDGWRPESGAGHGLDGLRERVLALGGALQAGPEGRGFRLVARLPDRAGPR